VVVPVLDDAGPLQRLLRSLGRAGIPARDVVVADGGSSDGSRAVAERWGARVVPCPIKGRGQQIAEGVRQLDTDLVLVLHADCVVSPAVPERLLRAAAAYPHGAGGAFRTRYDRRSIKILGVSFLNNAKTGLFGLSFGDQGQWFDRRRILVPEIPIMEDVETALRINDAGGAVWTPARIEVSARRYGGLGTAAVALSVVRRTLSYLIRRRWNDAVPDTRRLYLEYYGHGKQPSTGG
jgi:glycosyltransferase involved in cell wall biosynthesis